jgi:hypothetical protein
MTSEPEKVKYGSLGGVTPYDLDEPLPRADKPPVMT